MAQDKNGRLLTEAELEIMNVVWELGDCSVKQVQEKLMEKRTLAYTSVATFMRILEHKKILKSRKQEKAHLFSPKLTRNEYETISLEHIKKNVFQDSSSSLVMRLLDDHSMSYEELKLIKNLLNEKLKG